MVYLKTMKRELLLANIDRIKTYARLRFRILSIKA